MFPTWEFIWGFLISGSMVGVSKEPVGGDDFDDLLPSPLPLAWSSLGEELKARFELTVGPGAGSDEFHGSFRDGVWGCVDGGGEIV